MAGSYDKILLCAINKEEIMDMTYKICKKKNMKTLGLWLLSCFFIISLIGCGKTSDISYLTEEGVNFAKEHSGDERISDYYEAEVIITSATWKKEKDALKALSQLNSIAETHHLNMICDEISEYEGRINKGLKLDNSRINSLGRSFACYLLEKMYYEENPYQYSVNVNVMDYVSYFENQGMQSETIESYDGITIQLYNDEKKAASLSLDFEGNVKAALPKITLVNKALDVANSEKKEEEKNTAYANNFCLNVQSISFYNELQNSVLPLILSDNEIVELYNCLSSISTADFIKMCEGNLGLVNIYVETDASVVLVDASYGGCRISWISNRDSYKYKYPNFVNYDSIEEMDEDEIKITPGINSAAELVETINRNSTNPFCFYYNATAMGGVEILETEVSEVIDPADIHTYVKCGEIVQHTPMSGDGDFGDVELETVVEERYVVIYSDGTFYYMMDYMNNMITIAYIN